MVSVLSLSLIFILIAAIVLIENLKIYDYIILEAIKLIMILNNIKLIEVSR